jgi:hypothetical protein
VSSSSGSYISWRITLLGRHEPEDEDNKIPQNFWCLFLYNSRLEVPEDLNISNTAAIILYLDGGW